MAMPDTVPTTSGITFNHAALGAAASAKAGSDGPDTIMAPVVWVILPSDQAVAVLGGFCTDALHASLISRLAALGGRRTRGRRQRVSALPKRKLRKGEAPVDADTSEHGRRSTGSPRSIRSSRGTGWHSASRYIFTSSTYRVRRALSRG